MTTFPQANDDQRGADTRPPDRLRVIGSATSPFVRKVRAFLIIKAAPHEFVPQSSWDPSAGIERLNPLQKVPVLEHPGHRTLFDSRVIAQYLDDIFPSPALYAPGGSKRWRCMQLEALTDGISEAISLVVQEGWRPVASQSTTWRERQLGKVRRGLTALDLHWSERSEGLPRSRGNDHAWPVEDVGSAAAFGFAKLWLSAVCDDLDLEALHREQARWSTCNWFAATQPSMSSSPRFPAL